MSSQPQEHSVLIALRELDSLEQQRRDREAAEARARVDALARAEAERLAREHAAAELRQRAADAAQAQLAAERARQDHELRRRGAEIEAAVRAEQAQRVQQVQAELDAQLQLHAGRERGSQRLLATGILGALGLVGALGAMFLTQPPRLDLAAHDGGREHDLAVQEASAAIEAMRRELGEMRSDNAREQALLDAAAALLPGTPPPAAATVTTPRSTRPRPSRPTTAAPKPPLVKICKDLNDPLAEDC